MDTGWITVYGIVARSVHPQNQQRHFLVQFLVQFTSPKSCLKVGFIQLKQGGHGLGLREVLA